MDGLEFEWDKAKSASNEDKHGVSFEEAKSVFADEYGRLMADPDHSKDEDRYVLLGISANLRLLVVCHSVRGGGGIIRIISARKATRHERQQYEGFEHA